jgi:hypothetical protein
MTLSEVHHDGTLTGLGTEASKLALTLPLTVRNDLTVGSWQFTARAEQEVSSENEAIPRNLVLTPQGYPKYALLIIPKKLTTEVGEGENPGFDFYFNGEIHSIGTIVGEGTGQEPLPLLPDETGNAPVSNHGTIFPQWNNYIYYSRGPFTAYEQSLRDWSADCVVFGLRIMDQQMRAILNEALDCNTFNRSFAEEDQILLTALNAVSTLWVDGHQIITAKLERTTHVLLFGTNGTEANGTHCWLGAVHASSLQTTAGAHTIILKIHNTHITDQHEYAGLIFTTSQSIQGALHIVTLRLSYS